MAVEDEGTDPAVPAPSPEPEPHPNDPHKYRRLFEREEAKRKDLEGRLLAFEAAEAERRKAELSEVERVKLEAEEARAQVVSVLRRAVAAEAGVPADAIEFLSGTDEETLRAQAEKLAALAAKPAATATLPRAGTITNPSGSQSPSVDEQISAAERAQNWPLAITLKRQRAGLSL